MVIFLDGDNVTWTSYTPIDMCSGRFQIRGYMVEIFFQVFLRRRDLKCRYITGHNVLIFYFNLFF